MDRELLKSAEKYRKKRYKKKTWKKVVSVLGCMVVFCVTYALVLPAITQEEETFCGMDEHLHEDSCYVRLSDTVVEETLICPILAEPAHVHDPSCYELQGGHTHGEDCFLREIGQLTCTLAEEEGHAHHETCYSLKPLLCTAQEGHSHSDACYQLNELHCTLPEGHLHSGDCYLPGALLCDLPMGHVHYEDCFLPGELVCTAAEGHSHTEQCLVDGVLTCTEPENHLHGEDCYAPPTLICTEPENHIHGSVCHAEPTLICDQPEQHTHGLACCDTPVLICTEPERHTHGLDCYQDPSLACEQQEHHIHEDSCCAEMVQVCTDREAHRHSDACYVEHALFCPVADSQPELCDCDILWMPVCAQEEGHVHDLNCYIRTLTCRETQRSGHRHGELCHVVTETMICTLEEAPGEPVLICTLPEAEAEQPIHVHDETCYAVAENPLTCSLPEDEEHQHGPRCYGVWNLLCEIEEHTHDLTCRADLSADWETAADWESSFAYVPLSGVPAEDVVAIAQSQLGYSESQKNYIVSEGTTETKGYTRYGEWYGDPYGDWCAMFASFCLHYAEIDPAFPLESNCRQWRSALREQGLYREAGEYLPVPGDLVFFARNGSATLDHVGIVTAYDPDAQQITTVEGNKYNTVAGDSYFIHDAQIDGYGVVSGEAAEPIVLTEQTLEALIYTDGTYLQPAEDSTVITVSGMLPEGAQARAYPVTLETDLIDGQTVIMAYDISIFYGEEQLYEQADTPLSVTFRPADWEAPPEDADYTIYYIPEEGEPEPVETVVDEQAVNFLTDHFSTYAMTSGGTAEKIYLDGKSGNDSNNGTAAGRAVKTIEKAMSLVKDGGTIYISGTVTVTDRQEWDVDSKVTIQRYSDRNGSFTGPLITVSDGGELELRNITINGGSGTPAYDEPSFSGDLTSKSPDIEDNTTYASGSAKAPLIVVNDGGRLTLQDGATLTNNSNKPDTTSVKVSNSYGSTNVTTFKENGYIGLGGAIYCNGTLTMNGGLIRYCEAQCGGGVYLEGGSFYLNDGTIDHNYARDIEAVHSSYRKAYHKNAGGGVYVGENSSMTMTGGTISYNQSSREGGGISLGWLNHNNGEGAYYNDYVSTFTMNGGTITHNTATSTGGGLNVTAGYQAFINAGTFTYNVAYGNENQPGDSSTSWNVFSGGAIYVDAAGMNSSGNYAGVPGKVVLNRALITNNKATSDGGGGGVASCKTSTNYVYGTSTNGTAIYKNYIHGKTSSNELYIVGTKQVSDKLLGGGNYGWSQSGSTYTNKLDESSEAIKTARSLATVFITDNYAYLGGGIGCNGLVEIGGEEKESTYINIIKKWTDTNAAAHPDYIDVQILQDGKPYGEPIRIYRTFDKNGNEVWPTFYVGGLPKGHTYTVEELEVPGYEALIEQNGRDYTITNSPTGYRVTKKWLDEAGNPLTSGIPDSITVQLYQNDVPYGEPIELSAANNWVYRWQDLPEKDSFENAYDYRVEELEVPDGFYCEVEKSGKAHTITNTRSPVTVLSVEKRWDGVEAAESVQIQLYQNGKPYRDPIPLSQENDWFHKWDDLPTKTTTGADATYTVEELPLPGKNYTVNVEKTTYTGENRTEYRWVAAKQISSNKYYLLVNSDKKALAGSGNSGLQLMDVSAILANGTEASNAALWNYSNSRLGNKAGKFLVAQNSDSYYYSYTFATGNSGSNITFSDGKLSYQPYYTYYLTGISNGSGTTSYYSSEAMIFTAYERTSTVIEGEQNPHFIVTNSAPRDMEVPFAKYSTGTDSSGQHTLLAGAEFELYRLVSEPGEDTVTIPQTQLTGVLVDEWTSEVVTNDNPDGTHRVRLATGTYYLVETKAPPGHMGLSSPMVFTVDVPTNRILLTKCPDRPEYPAAGQPVEVIKVYNSAMVTLPETGGVGAAPYRLLGVGMMLAAVLMLYGGRKPRRRGRRADGS